MTTSIDQARAVLNSHSYPDKQQFIAQFSDAIIDQLSPEERLSAWTLGKSIRAFDQKELLCWGDTHVKANALALKLFGLNMDGRRITNEELPNSESRRWLMRSVHGRPTLPLPSGYYSERFLVASLLVSQWLRRNGTEHHMDAFKSFVWDQTLRVRWTARSEDILAEGVAQGLLP
ncbi:MAG: hypothetical protein KDK78_08670, partial [Chlamydiia bacterium]|nr:hypothetical protein [Chlamydiia bacterium]